ncbi:MAG: VOC family protein [Saprospiraceae bacterium]|nr:VOC family protein [Saprospiraceae bacterium]
MLNIEKTIPLVRIFDESKAREYYCDWLGFRIDWEHRFEEGTPIYMQVSLGNLTLHLSEHVGDCTPGGKVFLRCTGLREWHQSLVGKNYKYYRPSIEDAFWGGICMGLTDPFGNKLLFSEE